MRRNEGEDGKFQKSNKTRSFYYIQILTSSKHIIYIQTFMSHNYRNSYQFSSTHELHGENITFSDFKHLTATTAQGYRQNIQNQPIIQDGVFWNINRLLMANQLHVNPRTLDYIFQDQLLREHRVVIKCALNTYFSGIQGHEVEIQKQNYGRVESWAQGSFEQRIDNFMSQLGYRHQFRQMELEKLNKILNQNPQYCRIIEKLSETIPTSLKGEFYYIIFKGFEVCLKLADEGEFYYQNLDQRIEQNLLQIELQNQNLFEGKENPQLFKKTFFMIVYTVVMYSHGKSENKFYSEISETFKRDQNDFTLKIRSANSEKCLLHQEKENKAKKRIYLKRSISYPIAIESKGRKRQHFNEQI